MFILPARELFVNEILKINFDILLSNFEIGPTQETVELLQIAVEFAVEGY